jgi:hypothetical protein
MPSKVITLDILIFVAPSAGQQTPGRRHSVRTFDAAPLEKQLCPRNTFRPNRSGKAPSGESWRAVLSTFRDHTHDVWMESIGDPNPNFHEV